jgi:hypothetical protein
MDGWTSLQNIIMKCRFRNGEFPLIYLCCLMNFIFRIRISLEIFVPQYSSFTSLQYKNTKFQIMNILCLSHSLSAFFLRNKKLTGPALYKLSETYWASSPQKRTEQALYMSSETHWASFVQIFRNSMSQICANSQKLTEPTLYKSSETVWASFVQILRNSMSQLCTSPQKLSGSASLRNSLSQLCTSPHKLSEPASLRNSLNQLCTRRHTHWASFVQVLRNFSEPASVRNSLNQLCTNSQKITEPTLYKSS